MVNGDRPTISVVLACDEPGKRTLPASLSALRSDLAGDSAEVLVVVPPGTDLGAGLVEGAGTRAVIGTGTLVPELWGDGFRLARGDLIAFLIPECIVRPGWARALRAQLRGDVGGAGGYLALHASASATDAAVFFLRYSAFASPELGTREVRDVAGDNAMYRRDALDRHAATFADGFWEIDLHRRLRGEGVRLVMAAGAVAEFAGAPPLWTMARRRFTHGRHFGAWRSAVEHRPAWLSVLLTPAVPVVLAGRIVGRAWGRRAHRQRLLTAFPALVVLSVAWALGEAVGAMLGAPGKRT